MAVDKFQLLQWIADREDANPGGSLSGSDIRVQAAHLDSGPPPHEFGVSRALAQLRGHEWLDWVFNAWPNRPNEPPAHMIDDMTIQQVHDITVTGTGHAVLAARRPLIPAHQVNIINSAVGQLALGDISNIDLSVILEAAERCVDEIEAPAQAKEEARGVLRRMREVGAAAATTVGGEVLSAAVRRALGLP